MGKCIFCGDCERECPENFIQFTPFYKIAADSRKRLIVTKEITEDSYQTKAITARGEIKSLFGSSLKLRQVSAAGCNGCEWELNACGNVNFDMGRFGIDIRGLAQARGRHSYYRAYLRKHGSGARGRVSFYS